uniref:DUF2199 domain-containing protein n=1 Tax=Dinoroseobacter phage vB_DshS_R26L TaxID=3161158 RepID=A0AAU7VGI0_9CAUD
MRTIYQCEICGARHDTPEAALACEAQPMTDMKQGNFIDKENAHEPEVGEIVACAYPAWGWWHGDEAWRVHLERGGRFLDGFYNLWVVVAKIPAGDRHEWRYILWSPSNQNDREWMCWTGPGHNLMLPHGRATSEQLEAGLTAYDAVENKRRIPLM